MLEPTMEGCGMMKPENAARGNARKTEERYRASIDGAMKRHFGTTPEGCAWCEAEAEMIEKYDDLSPLEMAQEAWMAGDMEFYEEAVADGCRVAELARAAVAAEARKPPG